jgi:hypothetical protein
MFSTGCTKEMPVLVPGSPFFGTGWPFYQIPQNLYFTNKESFPFVALNLPVWSTIYNASSAPYKQWKAPMMRSCG